MVQVNHPHCLQPITTTLLDLNDPTSLINTAFKQKNALSEDEYGRLWRSLGTATTDTWRADWDPTKDSDITPGGA